MTLKDDILEMIRILQENKKYGPYVLQFKSEYPCPFCDGRILLITSHMNQLDPTEEKPAKTLEYCCDTCGREFEIPKKEDT